jgi:RND family efflux transporter MFP subunit
MTNMAKVEKSGSSADNTLRISAYDRARSDAAPAVARSNFGLWLVAGLIGASFVGFMGYRVTQALGKQKIVTAQRETSAAVAKKAFAYEYVRAEPMKWQPQVDLSGTLKPWREADIGFETPGRIVRVGVTLGETVKTGHLLATLDASRAGAQVNQAQAQTRAAQASVALAEDNLKRTESLVASQSIPEAQAEQARQALALARAQLDAAQATTRVAVAGAGIHNITAPFDGVITRAPSNPGAVVNPGVPMFRLEDISRFRLSGSVGEEDVDLVTRGAIVRVTYHDRIVRGVVSALVPSLDPATRRAPIEVEVPNDPKAPILGYGFVRASIASAKEVDALRIKQTARRPGSQNEVMIYDAGKAKILRVVHSTDSEGNWIVRSGLSGNEQILVNPSTDMKEGDAVTLQEEAPKKIEVLR